jgi:hypothetical protein
MIVEALSDVSELSVVPPKIGDADRVKAPATVALLERGY